MEELKELGMLDTIFKLFLSLICGGVLGIDRGRKNRPAGFRTYILVCVASTIVMLTNEYIAMEYGGTDPARMGAQVISGVGFLGAGTIIVTGRNKVKGLTTAAGLWAAAGIGLAIGVGYYVGAIVGCIIIFIAMELFKGLEQNILYKTNEISFYIEFSCISDVGKFLKYIKSHNMKISDMELVKSNNTIENIVGGTFTLILPKKLHSSEVIQILMTVEGVCIVEEL